MVMPCVGNAHTDYTHTHTHTHTRNYEHKITYVFASKPITIL